MNRSIIDIIKEKLKELPILADYLHFSKDGDLTQYFSLNLLNEASMLIEDSNIDFNKDLNSELEKIYSEGMIANLATKMVFNKALPVDEEKYKNFILELKELFLLTLFEVSNRAIKNI